MATQPSSQLRPQQSLGQLRRASARRDRRLAGHCRPDDRSRVPGVVDEVLLVAPHDLREPSALETMRRRFLVLTGDRRCAALLFDLSGVRTADSRLVALLVVMASHAARQNLSLRLQLSPIVQTWVEIYSVHRCLAPMLVRAVE